MLLSVTQNKLACRTEEQKSFTSWAKEEDVHWTDGAAAAGEISHQLSQ